jgi:hypothetical protein
LSVARGRPPHPPPRAAGGGAPDLRARGELGNNDVLLLVVNELWNELRASAGLQRHIGEPKRPGMICPAFLGPLEFG